MATLIAVKSFTTKVGGIKRRMLAWRSTVADNDPIVTGREALFAPYAGDLPPTVGAAEGDVLSLDGSLAPEWAAGVSLTPPITLTGTGAQGDGDFATLLEIANSDAHLVFSVDSSGEVAIIARDGGGTPLYVKAGVNPTGDVFAIEDSASQTMFKIAKDGAAFLKTGLIVRAANAAPADGTLGAGDFALWLDKTDGIGNTKLMIKAKSADGTVKTATIVLA